MSASNPEQPAGTRVRVRAAAAGRWTRLIVGLGALLLIGMVAAGSLNAPQPAAPAAPPAGGSPTPPAVSPGPSPADPALGASRFYVSGMNYGADSINPVLTAYETGRVGRLFSMIGVRDSALSSDGRRLYALYPGEIRAFDAASSAMLWAKSLPPSTTREAGQIAISPADGALILFRPLGEGAAALERFDAASGELAGALIPIGGALPDSELQVASNGSAYLISPYQIQVIDPNGVAALLRESPGGSLAAALSPGGDRLCIISSGIIEIHDAATTSELLAYPLAAPGDDRQSLVLNIAMPPAADRLAVLRLVVGPPALAGGQLMQGTPATMVTVIDLAAGERLMDVTESADRSQALAFGWDGAALYSLRDGSLVEWDMAAKTSRAVATLGANAYFTRLLSGPPIAFSGSAEIVPPPQSPQAAQDITATPLLSAPSEPVAWVRATEENLIVEYRGDGHARIVADRVIKVIPRAGGPPLLLTTPRVGQWTFIDPSAGTTVTLQMERQIDLFPPASDGERFVVSPDGTQCAFVTRNDPIASDSLTAAHQLVIADTRTGAIRVLHAAREHGIFFPKPLIWTDDGLYVQGSANAGGTALINDNGLWRISPAAQADAQGAPEAAPAAAQPERIMTLDADPAWLLADADADVIVYELTPDDPLRSEIRAYDRASQRDHVIYNGMFVAETMVAIDPAGATIAYLRPQLLSDFVELALYDRASGTTVLLSNGLREAAAPIHATPDGTLIFRSRILRDGVFFRREQRFRFADGALLGESAVPESDSIHTIASRLSDDGERRAELSLAADGVGVILSLAENGQSAPMTRFALSAGPSSSLMQTDSIVYVP